METLPSPAVHNFTFYSPCKPTRWYAALLKLEQQAAVVLGLFQLRTAIDRTNALTEVGSSCLFDLSFCLMPPFYVILLLGPLLLLANCTPAPPKADHTSTLSCNQPQLVYLYITNWSSTDDPALATLIIDDSVYFHKPVSQNETSDERFQLLVSLCTGMHRVSGRFGRFQRDTVLSVTAKSSFLMSMDYNPKWEAADNGLVLNVFTRVD